MLAAYAEAHPSADALALSETPKHFYEKNSWLSIGLATRPHKPAVFVGSAGEEYGIALHSNGMLVASELPKKERDAYRLVPRDLRAGDVVGVGYRVEQLLPGEFDTGEDSDVPDALQRSTPSERKKVKQARSKAAPEDVRNCSVAQSRPCPLTPQCCTLFHRSASGSTLR